MLDQKQKIPKGWKETTLGEVAEVNAATINGSYPFTEIEYIDVASVEEGKLLHTQVLSLADAPSRARRIVRDNDVLISTVRPNLKHYCFIKKSKPNLVASTGFAVVSATTADAYFLYSLLTNNKYTNYLSKIADTQTSTYPAFNPGIIANSKFLMPTPSEQRDIAEVLSSLNDKIELLREQNKALEATAQAIFKNWFISFDFPDQKGRPYKSSGGKMTDSSLGAIPAEWKLGGICEYLDIVYGFPFSSELFNKNKTGLPVIRIRDLKDGAPEIYTEETCPAQYKISPGDIIAGMDAEFRAVIWKGEEGLLNQRVCKFRPKENVGNMFVLETMRPHLNFYEKTKVGTTVSHIGKSDFDSIETIVPPKHLVALFSTAMEPLFQKLVLNNSQIQSLSVILNTILPKLMKGELRVTGVAE
jgi:type I restriction enzyme S subunit